MVYDWPGAVLEAGLLLLDLARQPSSSSTGASTMRFFGRKSIPIEIVGLLAVVLAVVAVVAIGAPQVSAQELPPSAVKFNALTNTYYARIEAPNLKQSEAASAALRLTYKGRSAIIAEPKSANTDTFLKNQYGNAGLHRIWIGGFRLSETSRWKWMNGGDITFFPWAPSEPNNVGTSNPSTGIYYYAYPGKQVGWADVNRESKGAAVGYLVQFPPH
jgi:hypothetical protein